MNATCFDHVTFQASVVLWRSVAGGGVNQVIDGGVRELVFLWGSEVVRELGLAPIVGRYSFRWSYQPRYHCGSLVNKFGSAASQKESSYSATYFLVRWTLELESGCRVRVPTQARLICSFSGRRLFDEIVALLEWLQHCHCHQPQVRRRGWQLENKLGMQCRRVSKPR